MSPGLAKFLIDKRAAPAEVAAILKQLDLYYPAQRLAAFWAAKKGGKIIGVVQFKEYPNFFFLSSLGVLKKHQGQGVATAIMRKIIAAASKDIYLYTVSPDLFKKFGFQPAALRPGLPSKLPLDCENCQPRKCVIMKRAKA